MNEAGGGILFGRRKIFQDFPPVTVLHRLLVVFPLKASSPLGLAPAGLQDGRLLCPGALRSLAQSQAEVQIQAQNGLPEIDIVEPHHEVDHRAAGIAAEAMPAAVSCVDLQRCGMISLMERAAHKSCAVWLEAIVPRNFVHRQTSLDLVRCVIRTVTRHRHHPGR